MTGLTFKMVIPKINVILFWRQEDVNDNKKGAGDNT